MFYCYITRHIHSPRSTFSWRQTFWRYNPTEWNVFRDFLSLEWLLLCFRPYPHCSSRDGLLFHTSKLGKRKFPEWFNHACGRTVCSKHSSFRYWCRSPASPPITALCKLGNRIKVQEHFVRCRRLLSSTTGNRQFWFLAKAVTIFLPSVIPVVISFLNHTRKPFLLPTVIHLRVFPLQLSFFLPTLTTRKVRAISRSLNASKPPGPNNVSLIDFKMWFQVSSYVKCSFVSSS